MEPEEVKQAIDSWVAQSPMRRASYVENEGDRRTWTLFVNGTQAGMVQGRLSKQKVWAWSWLGMAKSIRPSYKYDTDEPSDDHK